MTIFDLKNKLDNLNLKYKLYDCYADCNGDDFIFDNSIIIIPQGLDSKYAFCSSDKFDWNIINIENINNINFISQIQENQNYKNEFFRIHKADKKLIDQLNKILATSYLNKGKKENYFGDNLEKYLDKNNIENDENKIKRKKR